MKWAYGITTVPQRRTNLFARALVSLKAAGFDEPRLFIDGCNDKSLYSHLGLDMTLRWPTLRTHGNWVLGLYELYIREPNADRYAIFQDDIVACLGLRDYLDAATSIPMAYYNLYTMPPPYQAPPPEAQGWYPSNQKGMGALGLVFTQIGVRHLLKSEHLVERVQDSQCGYRKIDGGVVSAMTKAGYQEYVHYPSLLQHTGMCNSSMGPRQAQYPISTTFAGEGTNIMEVLCPVQ